MGVVGERDGASQGTLLFRGCGRGAASHWREGEKRERGGGLVPCSYCFVGVAVALHLTWREGASALLFSPAKGLHCFLVVEFSVSSFLILPDKMCDIMKVKIATFPDVPRVLFCINFT